MKGIAQKLATHRTYMLAENSHVTVVHYVTSSLQALPFRILFGGVWGPIKWVSKCKRLKAELILWQVLRQLLHLASIPREPDAPVLSDACHIHTYRYASIHTCIPCICVHTHLHATYNAHTTHMLTHKDLSRGWSRSPATCLPQVGSVAVAASLGGGSQSLG